MKEIEIRTRVQTEFDITDSMKKSIVEELSMLLDNYRPELTNYQIVVKPYGEGDKNT